MTEKTDERWAEIQQACVICKCSEATMRNWVRKAKAKDKAFAGLPYHQVAPGHAIHFDIHRLRFWWNNKTNVGSVNPV